MASTEIKDLLIRIRAETDQAMKSLDGVNSHTNNMGKIAGVAAKAFAIGGAAITAALGAMVKNAADAEVSQAKLNAVLVSTQGKAGMTSEAVNALASSYSQMTTFSQEAVRDAESLLLTFTSIGKDIFPTATETVLNMSQALGQDLKSSSIQLGKALNDPIQGMTALKRVGVAFTDEQVNLVKALQGSGDLMGAQTIILKELETEFGGAAKAVGETFVGQVTILKNRLSELGQSIGTQIMPVLQTFVTEINKNMPSIEKILVPLFASIGDTVSQLMPILLDLINTALPPLLEIFKAIIPVINSLLKAFLPLIKEILPPLTDLILYLVKEVLPLFTPIIGELVRAVIPPLVDILKLLVKDVLPPLMPLIKVLAELLVSLTPILVTLLNAFMPLIELGIKVLVFQLNIVIPIITFLIEKVLIPLSKGLDTVLKAFIPLNNWLKDTFLGMMQKVKNAWYDVQYAALSLRDKVVEIGTTIKTKLSTLYSDMINVGKNIINGILEGLKAGWNLLLDKIKSLGNLIPDWLKKILGIESPSKVMKDIFKWIVPGIVEGILVNINQLDNISEQIGAKLKTGLSNIATSIGNFDGFKLLNDTFKDVTVKEFNRFLGEIKDMIDKISEMGLAFQSINPGTIVMGIKSFIVSMSMVAEELKKLFNTGSMIANDPNSLTGLFDQLKKAFNTLNDMFKDLSISNVLTFMGQIKNFIDLLSEIGASEIKKGTEGFKGILETMIDIFSSNVWTQASEVVKKAIQDFADITKGSFATTAQEVKNNWSRMVLDIQTSITLNLLPLQTAMIDASETVKNAFISDKNAISDGWIGAINAMSLSASSFKGQISEMLEFLKAVATGEGIDSTGIKNTFLMLTQVVSDLTQQLYESIFQPVLETFGDELFKIPQTIRENLIGMMSDMKSELVIIVTGLADAFISRWSSALAAFKTNWTSALQSVKIEATAWASWFSGWINQVVNDAMLTLNALGFWISAFHEYINTVMVDLELLFGIFEKWMNLFLEMANKIGVSEPEPPEIRPPWIIGNPNYPFPNMDANPVQTNNNQTIRPITIQNLNVVANNPKELQEALERAGRLGYEYSY